MRIWIVEVTENRKLINIYKIKGFEMNAYAIIKASGQQFKVRENDIIHFRSNGTWTKIKGGFWWGFGCL